MAPGLCCVSGGAKPSELTGTVSTIHGLPTYISKPKGTPKGLVVIIPDAYGWDFVNSRVLADKLAGKGGFLVYLPHFMNGSIIPTLDLKDKMLAPSNILYKIFVVPLLIVRILTVFVFFLIRNRPARTMPTVTSFFTSLRSFPETKDMKIGAAGYCWGGGQAVLLTHGPTSLIDAGFAAYPMSLYVPDDIEKVQAPLCISIGDVTYALKLEWIRQAKDVLEKKNVLEKKKDTHKVHIIPGGKNGFAVRADPADPRQQKFYDQAETQMINWFIKWFA